MAELMGFNWLEVLNLWANLLPSTQGLGGVRFEIKDWGSVNLELTTREVDYKALDDLRKGFARAEAMIKPAE